MNDQRMVDVGLLELLWSLTPRNHSPLVDEFRAKLRAIINGPGVEPVAPVGYLHIEHFRGCKSMENANFDYVGDLPEGNYPLYLAAPSAPVQRLPEGCMWAVTKGGHSICQPPKAWDKRAPVQAVPDGDKK